MIWIWGFPPLTSCYHGRHCHTIASATLLNKRWPKYTSILSNLGVESGGKRDSDDMIWNLMSSVYKNGTPVPDIEVAHMMIALLMAGQHSSSSTSAWILLRLATRPDIVDQLYDEQVRILGPDLPALDYDSLQKLTLNAQVVRETLRMHAPIHTILRKVTTPMPVEGTPYVIPTSHNLLAAPGVTSKTAGHFPEPDLWEPHRWG